MGTRTSYAPGTPSWVDVTAADIETARTFYAELFGWTPSVAPEPEAGGYTMFELGDQVVAGGGPPMQPGVPDMWTVYMTVADADATLATIGSAGGAPLTEVMDVFDAGRMAVAADPGGSPFAIWEPKERIGADRVNDVGCFCWSELASRDVPASVAFYSAVFGWDTEQSGTDDAEDGATAAVFTIDGAVIGGVHAAGDDEPPYWSVWFTVTDCDATVDEVVSRGGSVFMPPDDMSFGRGAVVAAPGGAVFGVAAMESPDP